ISRAPRVIRRMNSPIVLARRDRFERLRVAGELVRLSSNDDATRIGRSGSHSYCGHQGVTRMIVSRTLWNPVQCSERELVSNQRLREPSSGTPVLSEIAAMLLLSDRALGNKAAAASTPSLLARMRQFLRLSAIVMVATLMVT